MTFKKGDLVRSKYYKSGIGIIIDEPRPPPPRRVRCHAMVCSVLWFEDPTAHSQMLDATIELVAKKDQ